ncbi:MAG TPA: site-2 protease family protein [Acidothermaceae bacterium]
MSERSPQRDGFRIAGFPVTASPTVLLLFVLIAFTTATGLLPASAPGASSGAYWVGGFVASALLLASLLVHELAHAVVARRHGIAVEGVTFWLFGGVAKLGKDAPTPRAEWRIAVVGPATNLVLAAAAFGVANALGAFSAPAVVVAVAGYVVWVNLMLGVFNLLPASPLDGGRILRAALWRRHGDRARATVTAAKAGQAMGSLLIGLGAAQFLLSSAIGGLWTALIGFFLLGSAGAEARVTATRSALAGLAVRDLLPAGEPLPAVPAWRTVAAFFDSYQRSGDTRTVMPVQDFSGSPAGLVALAHLAAVRPEDRDTVRVSAVAAPVDQIAVTNPDEQLADLAPRLAPRTRNLAAARLAGHALVVRDGVAVGVLTPADFARAVQLAKLRQFTPPSDDPRGPRDSLGDAGRRNDVDVDHATTGTPRHLTW